MRHAQRRESVGVDRTLSFTRAIRLAIRGRFARLSGMNRTRNVIMFAASARIVSAFLGLAMAFLVAPAAFGFYGRFQAIGLVFSVFACLRFERAVVSAPRLREAVQVTSLALRLLPFTALVAVAAAFLLAPDLTGQANAAALAVALWLAFLGRGLMLVGISWLLRTGRQNALSGMMLLQAIIQFAAQLLLLQLHVPVLLALILGEVVGAGAAMAYASFSNIRLVALAGRTSPRAGLIGRWYDLIVFNMPATLAAQVFLALPLIAVGHLADPATIGHVALAIKISDAPMALLTSVATSWTVAAGVWRGINTRSHFVLSAIFLGAVVTCAASLVAAALVAGPFMPGERLSAMLAYIPIATALSAAVALGGPHADLVPYAGAERRAFLIHAAALLAGISIMLHEADPTAALGAFAAVALCRSIALWVLFPRIVKV